METLSTQEALLCIALALIINLFFAIFVAAKYLHKYQKAITHHQNVITKAFVHCNICSLRHKNDIEKITSFRAVVQKVHEEYKQNEAKPKAQNSCRNCNEPLLIGKTFCNKNCQNTYMKKVNKQNKK